MDLNTDEIDGAEAIATIRQRSECSDLPVVVISDTASLDQMIEIQSIGIQGVIRRPWEYDEVEQTVELLLSA
jgi:CheY-like chemotaxis protein